MQPEKRCFKSEIRAMENEGKKKLVGYAALFDTLSQDLGGFVESIRRGSFTKTIQEADVRALFNHDANLVLGRNKANTLVLTEDDIGLRYEIDLPETTWANDLYESVTRGDIDQSSFAFRSIKDKEVWGEHITESGDKIPHRSLGEVELLDISPVTYPAYIDTVVQARDYNQTIRKIEHGLAVGEDEKRALLEVVSMIKEDAKPVLADHFVEIERMKNDLLAKAYKD